MAFKFLFLLVFFLAGLISFSSASTLYTESFTGNGNVSLVGWTGVYDDGGSNGGLAETFAWVWNNGICENLIYTNEYTIEMSPSVSIEFQYDLRKPVFPR